MEERRIQNQSNFTKILFVGLGILCLTPFVSPPLALFMGIVLAQFIDHPFPEKNKKITGLLLKISIVGLGFGMSVNSALAASKEGFVFTVATIIGTLILGIVLGKLLKIDRVIAFLISGGTAICGGSAIAALSPVVKANQKQISISLGVIFILNSIALFLFPYIGHLLEMTQAQFGLWSAIAIHDTSSVVGAASKYGDEALQIATTVKLARALWIIPLALLSAVFFKSDSSKIKIPYFIGLFIIAIILNTYLSPIQIASPYIVQASKAGLTLTLFLIGSGLSRELLKSVGLRPVFQGVILWLTISIVTLLAILYI